MTERTLVWARDGQDWPNRDASRFMEAAGLRWHVQVAGEGPPLLLLHGTGASTHSWRDLLPRLAAHFRVIAPDLPGHAFTSMPPSRDMSLPGMANAVAGLLDSLQTRPAIAVGHSAGAAVAISMALDRTIEPRGSISLNGALLPIGGIAGQVFSPLARVLASSRTAADLFAWWAGDKDTVRRLLAQTGSRLDQQGTRFYQRLAATPAHAQGALAMMANWDLDSFSRRLSTLASPLVLAVGTKDASIPPGDADRIRRILPGVTIERLRGLGHLAHEEDPAGVVDLIVRHAATWLSLSDS